MQQGHRRNQNWATGHPLTCQFGCDHDDVIKWKHFPRYWPFARGIHRSPVNSPHKGQGRGALKFSLICVWINGWVNNREAGDLRRYRAHYDVIVMIMETLPMLLALCAGGYSFVITVCHLFIHVMRPQCHWSNPDGYGGNRPKVN